jgi:hypothetical protein
VNTSKLLTENIAQQVIDFYRPKKEKRSIDLLLKQPELFLLSIDLIGSALLFYEVGCLSHITSTSDFYSILSSINEDEWCFYVLSCGAKKIGTEKIEPRISTYLKSHFVNLDNRITLARLNRYQGLSSNSLRRLGAVVSFAKRRSINEVLVQRGERKLDKIKKGNKQKRISLANELRLIDQRIASELRDGPSLSELLPRDVKVARS